MSAEKGPNTGPAMFAGVDAPTRTERNDSTSETVVGDGMEDFQMPEVDLAYAASLKPSKLHGNKLLLMVTFVCGTGVSVSTPSAKDSADRSVCLIRLRSRCLVITPNPACVR